MSNSYMVSIDRASQDELNAAHKAIKENANGWWHRHATVWIVNGKTARFWRDLIGAELTGPESSVLILRLPEGDKRHWAFRGPDAKIKTKWLRDNYS